MAGDRRQQLAQKAATWLHEAYGNHTQLDSVRAQSLADLLDQVAADAAAEALMTAFREDRTTVAHLGPVERLSCFLVKAEDLVARAAELRAPARTDEEN